jgi:hypothetical protein
MTRELFLLQPTPCRHCGTVLRFMERAVVSALGGYHPRCWEARIRGKR